MSFANAEEHDAFFATRTSRLKKFHTEHKATVADLLDELEAIRCGKDDDRTVEDSNHPLPGTFEQFRQAAKALYTEVEGSERKVWDA